jgi:hypothetical protein
MYDFWTIARFSFGFALSNRIQTAKGAIEIFIALFCFFVCVPCQSEFISPISSLLIEKTNGRKEDPVRFPEICPWPSCCRAAELWRRISRLAGFCVSLVRYFFVGRLIDVCSGILACLDGYMNIAMEQTEEYVNGQLKSKYGDAFIRGNNGTPGILDFSCEYVG